MIFFAAVFFLIIPLLAALSITLQASLTSSSVFSALDSMADLACLIAVFKPDLWLDFFFYFFQLQ